jgi:hypothetical protein
MGSVLVAAPPNSALENGRSQASLRSLAHAVQRGLLDLASYYLGGFCPAYLPARYIVDTIYL